MGGKKEKEAKEAKAKKEKKEKSAKKEKHEKAEKKEKREKHAEPAAAKPVERKTKVVDTKPVPPREAPIVDIESKLPTTEWCTLDTWGMAGTTNLATRRVIDVIRKHNEFGRDMRSLDAHYDPDQYVMKTTEEDLFAGMHCHVSRSLTPNQSNHLFHTADGLLPAVYSSTATARNTYSRTCAAQGWRSFSASLRATEAQNMDTSNSNNTPNLLAAVSSAPVLAAPPAKRRKTRT